MVQDKKGIVLFDSIIEQEIEEYRIKGYRKYGRIMSKSEAIRILVVKGLTMEGCHNEDIVSTPKQPETSIVTPSPKPVRSTSAPKRVLPKKHDWPALWNEYQEAKSANPELSEAAFGRLKGIDKAFLSKNFKQFKTTDAAPLNQPDGLSVTAVGTV